MIHKTLLTTACLVASWHALGCTSTMQWRYYAPFRIAGSERFLTPVDPAEVHYAGVLPKLHYISLTVDGIFFRNLPKTLHRQVALGITLSGALDGREIKTISEPVAATGPNGFIHFDRPFSVEPFLYGGKPLRLTLSLRDVGPKETLDLRGRLSALGLSGLTHRIDPALAVKLGQHATQFEAFMGGAYKGKLYSYEFSLYPSDMEGVRQDLVVTGGRHVYVAIPSRNVPGSIRRLTPADLVYKLRLTGRRLEWRHDQREYEESPYILLSIIRYKRYPRSDTELKRAARRVDALIEQGNWAHARASLPDIGTALLHEKSLTQLERNLEVAWRDVRAARIDHREALSKGDKAPALAALLREVRRLGEIGKDFQPILEPAEVKDLQFQVRRLGRQAGELAAELGRAVGPVEKANAAALAGIRPAPEPPSSPSLTLKPPEVVTIRTEVPTPFYKQWWFYIAVGAAGLAAAGLGTYVGLSTSPPPDGPTVIFRGLSQPVALRRWR